MKKKVEKEVANDCATSQKVRETSFGSTPADIGMAKGSKMATFGYKIRGNQIFPGAGETTSVDSKTKFPEDRGF